MTMADTTTTTIPQEISNNNAETKFLQGHHARAQAVKEKQQASHERKLEIQKFESQLVEFWKSWDVRLDCLVLQQQQQQQTRRDSTDNPNNYSSQNNHQSSQERQHLRNEIQQLSNEIQQLRSHVLQQQQQQQTNLVKITSNQSSSSPLSPFMIQLPQKEELSATELRLFHIECTNKVAKLESVKKQILPKGKFVFTKYRSAIQNQQSLSQPPPPTTTVETTNQTVSTDSKQQQQQQKQQLGNIIENLSNKIISVHLDGTITTWDKSQIDNPNNNSATASNSIHASSSSSSSSWLIRNLNNCQVTIFLSIQSLHLLEIENNCIVVVNEPSTEKNDNNNHHCYGNAAVHVTSCHEMTLHVCAQQLRVHDSSHLQLYYNFNNKDQTNNLSGAILEDCTNISFFVSSEKNMSKNQSQVKDFNWLRNGIPSPNFQIVVQKEKYQSSVENDSLLEVTDTTIEAAKSRTKASATTTTTTVTTSKNAENDSSAETKEAIEPPNQDNGNRVETKAVPPVNEHNDHNEDSDDEL